MSSPIDPTPEPVESAAEYRVNAQELSHVVHIIQARKEAEARHQANTVALKDAVEQLGLDMTPDQLLAEIQAERARRFGASRPKRQNPSQRHAFAKFAVCAGIAGMMAVSIHQHRLNRAAWESRHNPYFFASIPLETPVATEEVTPSQSMAPLSDLPPPPMMNTGEEGNSLYSPLAQYRDGQLADCGFEGLRALAAGKSDTEVPVLPNGTEDDKLWTVEKRDGEVMVHVFATPEAIGNAFGGSPAHVSASMHAGLEDRLIPVRLFLNAQLLEIPGNSGAVLNPGSVSQQDPFADSKPVHWAYQAVTEYNTKDGR